MHRILVVGGTGQLGRVVVPRMREAGLAVRALVRPGRDNEVTQAFEAAGVELVRGDLNDPASLAEACRGEEVVVSMATATSSQVAEDSIETVDTLGNLALVDAAEAAKVSHFVFVSFADIESDFALKRAKASVEARLKSAQAMTYTVLKPVYFMETWLPGLGPLPPPNPAYILGTAPVSWIARADVARCVVAAAQSPSARNKVIPLGGPEALSPLAVFELFQALGAPKTEVVHVPEQMLRDELKTNASHALMEAFAALKLGVALGLTVDPAPALALTGARLGTVREFVSNTLEAR